MFFLSGVLAGAPLFFGFLSCFQPWLAAYGGWGFCLAFMIGILMVLAGLFPIVFSVFVGLLRSFSFVLPRLGCDLLLVL